MTRLSRKAILYISVVSAVGMLVLILGLYRWESSDTARYFCYFALALLTTGLKVNLPAITGTLSVNFLFILMGIVELTLPQTVLMGCAATLVQCVWHARGRWRVVQMVFNVANMAIAIQFSHYVHRASYVIEPAVGTPFLLMLTATTFFVTNTFPVAAVIALTEGRQLRRVWKECYFWSFPYYLVGCAAAGLFSVANTFIGWKTSILVLPVVYLIYRSYRLYVARLDDQKRHTDELASLHMRSIEALALAIEAKDHNTHDHLKRVQVYAMEVGRDLDLNKEDLDALRAAALLHDIGKLAVPEHIISKPGKLTPEQFEKMKIHPVVGAEILERVNFPYPVAPIVRAHHEKWDGSGYPHGLKGEEIPLGARILTAVDCLAALASDRQYRRALPLDEAMARIVAESGTSFDPQVVGVLQRRYKELERMAQAQMALEPHLSTDLKIERGEAPAAGFESGAVPSNFPPRENHLDFLTSIAAARQEAQDLFELTQDLGNSLSIDETLSVLAVRLRKLVSFDSMAIFIRRDKRLVPQFVTGEHARLFSALEIPLGEGLVGWVGENRRPIVNGNLSVEPGFVEGPHSRLRSALAVPLEGVNGLVGVLSLYHADRDAFAQDDLRILLAITSKIALAIENALKFSQAEKSATIDFLSDLPNARSLFLHLDSELARCRRQDMPLTVLVCDLDGFKQVNDRFGHLEGNRLLHSVAAALKGCCREYDYVARMGGDEFVLVLPGLDADGLAHKAQQIRQAVREASRLTCGDYVVSVSIGQAHYQDDGVDAEQLLAEADRRMYKSKPRHRPSSASHTPGAATEWLASLPATTVQ